MRALTRMVAPLKRRVMLMVGRGIVRLVNDSLKLQELQVSLLADEVRNGLEHVQAYGFSAHPHPGAEAVVVFIGGNRDHGLVIAVGDRRYRLTGLAQGEVALYTDEDAAGGHRVVLRRGRVVEIVASQVNLTGHLSVTGNISATGTIMDAGGNTNHHVH